jgi:hypothetical protein
MRQKALLFQSKKQWRGTNRKLLGQTKKLIEYSPFAVVVNYESTGFDTVAAGDVIKVNGNRRELPQSSISSLAELLGDEFVRCRRGDVGLFWSPERRTLYRYGDAIYSRDLAVKHVMSTRVGRIA